jgi:hypothetical protein
MSMLVSETSSAHLICMFNLRQSAHHTILRELAQRQEVKVLKPRMPEPNAL